MKKVFFSVLMVCMIMLASACKKEPSSSEHTPDTPGASDTSDTPDADFVHTDQDHSLSGNGGSNSEDAGMEQKTEIFKGIPMFGLSQEQYQAGFDRLLENRLELGKGFEAFCETVNDMYDIGVRYMELGIPIPAQYGLTFAQGSVSALRLAAGQLLKEKGVSVSSVAYPEEWEELYGLNLSTPVPFFMEAELLGETDKARADELVSMGEQNPLASEMELAGLGSLLREYDAASLSGIYEKLLSYEKDLYGLCAWVPEKGERMQNSFSSEYHMLVTLWYLEQNDMAGASKAVEKVAATAPFDLERYAYAARVKLAAGDMEGAAYFVNNGLLLDKENGEINLMAALLAYGCEDLKGSEKYYEEAVKCGVAEEYSDILLQVEKAVKAR